MRILANASSISSPPTPSASNREAARKRRVAADLRPDALDQLEEEPRPVVQAAAVLSTRMATPAQIQAVPAAQL
jgi:hypothetical protein